MEHGNKNKSRPLPVKPILYLIFAVNQGRTRSGFYTVGDQLLWIEKGKTKPTFTWEDNKEKTLPLKAQKPGITTEKIHHLHCQTEVL